MKLINQIDLFQLDLKAYETCQHDLQLITEYELNIQQLLNEEIKLLKEYKTCENEYQMYQQLIQQSESLKHEINEQNVVMLQYEQTNLQSQIDLLVTFKNKIDKTSFDVILNENQEQLEQLLAVQAKQLEQEQAKPAGTTG